jgi:hypothetical protein
MGVLEAARTEEVRDFLRYHYSREMTPIPLEIQKGTFLENEEDVEPEE